MKKIERPSPSDPSPSSNRLPVSSRPPPSSRSNPSIPASGSSTASGSSPGLQNRDLILYVEDEDENWRVAELRLKRNYDLLRAANDREACAALVQHRERLTAVLMDIQLHGSTLDGIQLTRLIRGRLAMSDLPPYAQTVKPLSIPVIFVTAYSARYSESELVTAGGNRMLTKPIDFVQLTSALTQLRLQRVMDLSSPWKDS